MLSGKHRGAITVPNAFGTPAHWRSRAEEARAMAEQITDEMARRSMLDIAEGYERIAQRAEMSDQEATDA
jgi:hypothetical protein